MREVTRYEADDGRLFETAAAAKAHDRLTELAMWYEDNKLYGTFEGCRIQWDDLIAWLRDNKEEAKAIINALKENI